MSKLDGLPLCQCQKALTELNAAHLVENINFDLLSNLKTTLAPISAAVEALGRNDSNIFTALGVINILENKLYNSAISKDLLKISRKA